MKGELAEITETLRVRLATSDASIFQRVSVPRGL